jgi:hypothetical protein
MINQKSVQTVGASRFGTHFSKPLFDSYSFARLAGTIEGLLTGDKRASLPPESLSTEQSDLVVLLFLDGFGWRFLEKYAARFPFLQHFIEEGIASKITSLFPSTTAAHVTSLNTGMSVAESGIYEWFYFEPKLDRVIAPLLFSFAGDKKNNTLAETGISPSEIYPSQTVFQKLQQQGISSFVLQQSGILYSPYSEAMFKGASKHPFDTFEGGLEKLLSLMKGVVPGEKAYFYLYFSDIDSAGHRHGIDSPQFELAVAHCFEALETIFWKGFSLLPAKATCLVIADHGMTAVDPKTTLYLNQLHPGIEKSFKKNKEGMPIVPAGSCRDFFLHIEEEKLAETETLLRSSLAGKAEVMRSSRLIEEGFFGPRPPSDLFLQRVGNLVILPYEGEAVWWYEKHRFEQHFYAAHGGLTKEEMETIFLCSSRN